MRWISLIFGLFTCRTYLAASFSSPFYLQNYKFSKLQNVVNSDGLILRQSRLNSMSPRVAVKARYVSYSDDTNLSKSFSFRSSTYFGSLYEALRIAGMKENCQTVLDFEVEIQNGTIKLTVFELWLIVDKFINDSEFRDSDFVVELVNLAVKRTEELDFDSSENDIKLQVLRFEILRKAISSLNSSRIIIPILRNLKIRNHLQEDFTKNILVMLIETFKFRDGPIPTGFSSFIDIILELGPIKCYDHIFRDLYSDDLPTWMSLSPFYIILKHVREDEFVPLKRYLDDCEIEFNPENAFIISEFIRVANFCSSYVWTDEGIWLERSNLLKFIFEKFQVSNFNETFLKLVGWNHFGFVEAFLCFISHEHFKYDIVKRAFMVALINSFAEICVLIPIYTGIHSLDIQNIFDTSIHPYRSNMNLCLLHSVIMLVSIVEKIEDQVSEIPARFVEDDLVKYTFSEPLNYEKNISFIFRNTGIDPHWVTRLILNRYFGFSFVSTRISEEHEANPIWREIIGAVNFFLDQACRDEAIKCKVVI